MRFWEDMQTKYGFGDGDAMPDGIEIYRTIYIRAVNRLAAELGSGVRVAAYDRNGLHNWCLIVMYQLVDLQSNPDQDLTQHTELSVEVVAPDEFIQEAIRQAYELNLGVSCESWWKWKMASTNSCLISTRLAKEIRLYQK